MGTLKRLIVIPRCWHRGRSLPVRGGWQGGEGRRSGNWCILLLRSGRKVCPPDLGRVWCGWLWWRLGRWVGGGSQTSAFHRSRPGNNRRVIDFITDCQAVL